ncbi:TPA: hypothetical protein JA361_14425 [Legionella pneumophila]|nr:hypothetical protein [Legionella pneumophila]HAT8183763.1 hypothetical protein [Legionella pneumophila]
MLHAAKPIPYTILLTDKDGNSYFKAANEELNPAKVGFTSQMLPVHNVFFGKGSGKEQDWHNPAQKLFIIVLSGVMQIETSRGEIKNFNPGEILLAEDLTGKGHKTRSLNGESVNYLAIPLVK